jgi:trans-aconitate methyltransferase
MAYDFDGKKYEKASAHQKEWGSSIIASLEFRGGERILDLGCGDGFLTSRIADLVPTGDVLGIDGSRGMIEAAYEKRRPNLRFMLLDINDIEFKEEFDVLFSNAALHWIKDHGKLLRNVVRALRPGGRVRFNFAADGNCSNFFRVMREAMALEPFSHSFRDFSWPWFMPSLQTYQTLVAESPLRDARVWCENVDRYFPNAETMVRWIDQPSLVPFLLFVEKAQRAPFRRFVINRMIELTRQSDGTCFETFRRVNLAALK